MDFVYNWMEPIFRWAHVVAGVLWIGLLYFFNWVNGSFAKTLDAATKQKVVPELLPRTLYFFRWGAAYTWITGVLLLVLVFYSKNGIGTLVGTDIAMRCSAIVAGIVMILLGAVLYDLFWKAWGIKHETSATAISFMILVMALVVVSEKTGMQSRALYLHLGALFGTCMAMNVWMRIWPAQRRIIAAIKAGETPNADDPKIAGLRSKHNTYMSVPLIFTMVSNHFPAYYGAGPDSDYGWIVLAVVVVIGFGVTKLIYIKSASDAPLNY